MNKPMFPDEHVSVASPQDLVGVLRLLRELVVLGELVQVNKSSTDFSSVLLADVSDDGPWPDFLDMRFRSPAGRRYRLSVETFHGTGGSWAPDDDLGSSP
jgi:hypothetical protein